MDPRVSKQSVARKLRKAMELYSTTQKIVRMLAETPSFKGKAALLDAAIKADQQAGVMAELLRVERDDTTGSKPSTGPASVNKND